MLSINYLRTVMIVLFDKGCFLPMLGVMTPLNPIQNPIQSMTYTQAVKECFLDALKNIGLFIAGTIIAATPVILSILFGMFLVAFVFAPLMELHFR